MYSVSQAKGNYSVCVLIGPSLYTALAYPHLLLSWWGSNKSVHRLSIVSGRSRRIDGTPDNYAVTNYAVTNCTRQYSLFSCIKHSVPFSRLSITSEVRSVELAILPTIGPCGIRAALIKRVTNWKNYVRLGKECR